jgi:hypothetical protein
MQEAQPSPALFDHAEQLFLVLSGPAAEARASHLVQRDGQLTNSLPQPPG